MDSFFLTEKDILRVYKEEGKLKEYNYAFDYIKFRALSSTKKIKEMGHFNVKYSTLLKWKNEKRVPYGIKCLEFFKKRNLLPYYPNEFTARIVGFLHGDGYLFDSLGSFGFVSKDKTMLLKIKKDVEGELKIKGKLKKKRDKGDIEFINNNKVIVKNPTYALSFNCKALGHLFYKLGVPKGKKIYQEFSVPHWIMNGNKNIKKSFLQGLFDSELSNSIISSFKWHTNNLSSPRMEMSKIKHFENNLRLYLTQIKSLLKDFGINSKVAYLRKHKNRKISLTLSINNKLSNIYNFIDKLGFYYNKKRIIRALRIKKLSLEKIKNKNVLYKVLCYCKNKPSFTMQNLEQDLSISKSFTKIIGLYLYKNKLANRRLKNRRFYYYPKLNKINKIIKNPLILET